MNRQQAFNFIDKELDWQNKKWDRKDGDWPSSDHKKLAILAEEFGEVAQAINDGKGYEVADELADTAATCIAWLISDFDYDGGICVEAK